MMMLLSEVEEEDPSGLGLVMLLLSLDKKQKQGDQSPTLTWVTGQLEKATYINRKREGTNNCYSPFKLNSTS